MIRSIAILGAALAFAGLALWSCGPSPRSEITFRQTVTVEGPVGRVTNSGVFTETISYNGFTLGLTGPSMSSHISAGEALAFDVPGVGLVVQTLRDSSSIVSQICGLPRPQVGSRLDAMLFLHSIEQVFKNRCELHLAGLQMVVIFEEVGPPARATAYDPDSLPPDVKIISVVIERTSDHPEYGRLPSALWARLESGSMQAIPLLPGKRAIALSEGYFVQPMSAQRDAFTP